MGEGTQIIRAQYTEDPFSSVVPPVYLSAVFGYISDEEAKRDDRGEVVRYSREVNPTLRPLERAVASLEGSDDALAFSSGMSSIVTTFMALLRRGAKVLTLKELYGASLEVIKELTSLAGGSVKSVYPDADSVVEELSRDSYDLVFVEVMTNPTLKVIDVREVARAASEAGAALVVDNTFTTPLLVRPIRLGATVVVHSSTKYLSGHDDVVGGVVATGADLARALVRWRRLLGTIQQPFEAYLTYRGLKTLPVRFERVSRTAKALAEFLHDHSRVRAVHYPGLPDDPSHSVAERLFERKMYGGVLSFTLKGGLEEAKRFLRSLRLARPAPSLGGTETLVTIPTLTASSHIPPEDRALLGIEDSLVRVSVGLEDPEDLIEDFSRALSSLS